MANSHTNTSALNSSSVAPLAVRAMFWGAIAFIVLAPVAAAVGTMMAEKVVKNEEWK